MTIRYVCVKSLGKWKKELVIVNSMLKLKNNYDNTPRHHNAIMLELTDFDDNKISYLARMSRGHHVDTLLVPREYKDTFESTELYKMLLPNISMGGVQFATIYYYD